jgi:hypothetical protein
MGYYVESSCESPFEEAVRLVKFSTLECDALQSTVTPSVLLHPMPVVPIPAIGE